MTVIQHPRFKDLAVVSHDDYSPDLDGASCAGTAPDAWYYPERDDDNFLLESYALKRVSKDHTIATHYKMLTRICEECPVLAECFNYSVNHELYGFWAGTNAYQRSAIRNKNRILLKEPYNSRIIDMAIMADRKVARDNLNKSQEEEYGVE